jgi:hypothetical protein
VNQRERMRQRGWNIAGSSGAHYLSLGTMLRKYRQSGHKPERFNCECCYTCSRCGLPLIDDLRADYAFNTPCRPAREG